MKAHATIWNDAPELAIPDNPAIFSNSDDLWLAYETTAEPRGDIYAVIRFADIIDLRLSPINDEGLGQHPYASAGLKWYSFNEVIDSQETLRWKTLEARHWVITFQDVTLDVVARSAQVIVDRAKMPDPVSALLSAISVT